MNCTTPDCKGKVTKHKKLELCTQCYRRTHYDKTLKSLPRKQARGNVEGVWTRCWRKDCRRRYKAGKWQDPKYSLCPKCKREAERIGVGLGWVERTISLPRRVG